jgi:FkbM family methyltransferase
MKELVVKIDNKKYKLCSDDNYIEHVKNNFEPEMIELFKTIISKDSIIIDIGANIGCTTIFFAENSKKVYSFEPSKTTFEYLEKNINQAGFKNAHLFNIGLGSENFKTTLTYSSDNRAGGFVSNLIHIKEGHIIEEIEIHKLDSFLQSIDDLNKLDFIKIDAEGFEPKILKGSEQTLAMYKPVIILELNHWCLNAFQRTSIPDFFDQLRVLFPFLYAIESNTYLDLHNEDDSYLAMYRHILQMKYKTIIAAYDLNQLAKFKKNYKHSRIL